ncbi:MAG: helix-turn-helix domain-containing protein [Maribacter sp.]|uniref:helix-turn-helix domain-containing protein n=1 Tax=Maribacter sp. TaxID=1897614 RepID=UPI003296F177
MQSLLNQLVYFGFFQSLLLLFIYGLSPKNRKRINGYMAFFIGIVSFGLVGKVLYTAGIGNYNFRLISLSELSALLFGPTIFLFSRSIVQRKSFTKQDLVHYLPALVYVIFVLVYFVIPNDTVISGRAKTGELMRVIYACHAIGLVVNIAYWLKGWQLLMTFKTEVQNELSYEPQTQFLHNFLIITGICLLVWTGLLLTSFLGFDMLERNARPYIWILLVLIILFITYYGMIAPQVLQLLPVRKQEVKKYTQSKLSATDLDRLKERLDILMIEKKPYLNSKLLKGELAEMLGVNNPELARLLNENIGMNFFEYVNYYRIKEFVALAKTEKAQQLTFFGLAQEAGFHSKTTFNKSFKKLMGSSPSAYFDKNL